MRVPNLGLRNQCLLLLLWDSARFVNEGNNVMRGSPRVTVTDQSSRCPRLMSHPPVTSNKDRENVTGVTC